MQLYQIIILLTLHWIFEFALCKSEADSHGNINLKSIFKHSLLYSFGFFSFIFVYIVINIYHGNNPPKILLLFPLICFIGHSIISFIMNNINAKLWNARSLRQLFINIGFEQLLYQLFLVVSFYLLNL